MNIALIDDGVEINNITSEYVCEFLEVKDIIVGVEKQTTNINSYSHGTICASIIRKISKSAKIYSIKILDNNNLSAGTDKLEKAFEWCLKNNIHMINLSLGTINSKDFTSIKRWIRCLVEKKIIIVASINNNNTYTVPASLSEVIGVSSKKELDGYVFLNDSFIGIDIFACSNHDIQLNNEERITTPYCNSFAAPAVTGKISELLNKDYKSMEQEDREFITVIKEKLDLKYKNFEFNSSIETMVKYGLNQKRLLTNHINEKKKLKKKVPIINLKCSEIDLHKFNNLFYNDNIFPVAIYDDDTNEKEKKIYIHIPFGKIIELMDCDVIILHNITIGFRGLLYEDLCIEYSTLGFKLSYRMRFKKVEENYQDIKAVYRKIIDLLE